MWNQMSHKKLCSNQWNKCQWSLGAWDWVGSTLLASFKLCFLIVFSWKRFQLSALDQSVSSLCKALFLAERNANRPTPCKAATFVGMWSLAADRQAQTGPQYFFFLSFSWNLLIPQTFSNCCFLSFLVTQSKEASFRCGEAKLGSVSWLFDERERVGVKWPALVSPSQAWTSRYINYVGIRWLRVMSMCLQHGLLSAVGLAQLQFVIGKELVPCGTSISHGP